jgi:hypothetical protein
MATLRLFMDSGISYLHCATILHKTILRNPELCFIFINEYGRINHILSEEYIYSIFVNGIIYREYGGGVADKVKGNHFKYSNHRSQDEWRLLTKMNEKFNPSTLAGNKSIRKLKVKNSKNLLEELKRLEFELRNVIGKQKVKMFCSTFKDLEMRHRIVENMISECINLDNYTNGVNGMHSKPTKEQYHVPQLADMMDRNKSRKPIHEAILEFEDNFGALYAINENARAVSKSLYESLNAL